MEKDRAYLQHIRDAIDTIVSYTKGISFEAFTQNKLLQDGVIREIEIVGEAAKNVSDALRAQHTDIPWADMAGMRDKLIHGYFGVDLELVWETAQKDLLPLKEKVLTALVGLPNIEKRGVQ